MCAPRCVCTAVRVQCGLPLLVCRTDMIHTHAVLVLCAHCVCGCVCISSFFFKIFYLFILFMAVLGLRFCARAFSSCGKRGPLFITVRGPPTIAASPVAERRLQTRRLSNCGSRAQLFCGTWDPPRPGLEPVSPALAGRLSTAAPPGKPCISSCWPFFCPVYGCPMCVLCA